MLAVAFGVLAAGCTSSDAARNALPTETATSSAIADPAEGTSIVSRLVAAAKLAETEPHGGIGDPATATSP
jgi:hypothetical protein